MTSEPVHTKSQRRGQANQERVRDIGGTVGLAMEKVLIVEDDRAVQRALKRLFESENYLVELTPNGKAGLDAFHSSPPSVVVLDLRLPGIPGSDVCREIKKKAPSLPVIVLSAKTDVADKVLLLETGADDYVTKPFSPRELLARVHAVVRRASRVDGGGCLSSTASPWTLQRWS